MLHGICVSIARLADFSMLLHSLLLNPPHHCKVKFSTQFSCVTLIDR